MTNSGAEVHLTPVYGSEAFDNLVYGTNPHVSSNSCLNALGMDPSWFETKAMTAGASTAFSSGAITCANSRCSIDTTASAAIAGHSGGKKTWEFDWAFTGTLEDMTASANAKKMRVKVNVYDVQAFIPADMPTGKVNQAKWAEYGANDGSLLATRTLYLTIAEQADSEDN